MNLYLEATISLVNPKTNKPINVTKQIILWQTPTPVTKEAIRSDNPLEVYTKWVNSMSDNNSDLTCSIHLKEVTDSIKHYEEEGFTLEWFEL